MKDWIRISSHFVDCRNGKKENGGVSVLDWVDLPDWDLLQIWVWMRCGWFVASFGVHFERFGGMIITSSFHDSDWISIISDAGRHYFRVRTAITLSPMPLNELWGGWRKRLLRLVWQREGRSITSFVTVSIVDCLQELRCLFVREEWREYCLWLWDTSCSWMRTQEDSQSWYWACLNIIS